MTHPLTGNVQWKFWQPYLQAKVTFLVMGMKGDKATTSSAVPESTCREGILENMRTHLHDKVLEHRSSWRDDGTHRRIARIRLFDERLQETMAGGNQLRVSENGLKRLGEHDAKLSKDSIAKFLMVADAVVGIPSILLSHMRPEGEWWRSDPDKCIRANYVCWNGTDNWFLRHPALLSVATGLYRQAGMLHGHGFSDQILECVSREDVEEALTTGDTDLAERLAKKLRPWIEVPVGIEGSPCNYPFPIGQWKRFDYLQRAQRRHNYKKVFGGSFYDSWGLEEIGNGEEWLGTLDYWGRPGKENPPYDTPVRLGTVKRRTRSASKS